MNNCKPCAKITWIIRILVWAAMLYFGVMKLWADAGKIAFIWWAAHDLGLTFLSVTTWYWIALIGQIVSWILLLLWWKATCGAALTLIIFIFIWNTKDWNLLSDPKAGLICIGALIVLFKGSGTWALQEESGAFCKYCKWWSCGTKPSWGCCGWSCHTWEDVEIYEA